MSSVFATSEAAIFGRLLDAVGDELTPDLANHVLKIRFTGEDNTRMHELLAKSTGGELTSDEHDELECYNHVGDLLSLWHSKARIAWKPSVDPS